MVFKITESCWQVLFLLVQLSSISISLYHEILQFVFVVKLLKNRGFINIKMETHYKQQNMF